MHYYNFNIGDYHSHTAHLDPLEDIAYRRMLDFLYLNEIPLPESVDEIARLIRMRSHTECIAIVLREFFKKVDGGYIQERAFVEIENYREKSEKARKSAEARWASKSNGFADANALRTQCEGNANQEPINNNQYTHTDTSGSDKSPPCPHQEIIDLYHRHCPTLTQVRIWSDARRKHLQARWRESEKHQNLGFWERYFRYVAESDFLLGQSPGQGGKAWRADMEWLVKSGNFVKVIEGKYHGASE